MSKAEVKKILGNDIFIQTSKFFVYEYPPSKKYYISQSTYVTGFSVQFVKGKVVCWGIVLGQHGIISKTAEKK
jgi:hypothetical protein